MLYSAFFFDFDGVLVDSVEVKTKAFSGVFAEFGGDFCERVVAHHRAHGGMSRFDKFRHYFKEFLGREITQGEMDDCCETFARLVVDEVVRAPEIRGATAFVNLWCERLPCFIVSATPQDEIREIARQRGLNRFAEILGSPRSKVDNLLDLLDRYRIESSKAVFFGDAISDYDAAKETGVDFVGIANGSDSPLAMHAGKIQIFRDFSELARQPEFQ